MRGPLIILTLCSLLLTACGGTPTPDIEATVQAAIAATQTAQPTKTPTPDIEATVQAAIAATQTAQPTNTPTPTETPTPAPTETLTPTETPKPPETPSPTDTPAPTATPTPEPTATPTQVVHVVQVGETLFEIAREYGVSVETLIAANNITDRGLVQVGQELAIPPSDAAVVQAQPTATSTLLPTDTPVEELPDENKALIIETALRSNESVVVKAVRIGRETGKESILVVIETQGGAGSIADETTLIEAAISFIYAYEGNQQLELETKYVVVQAQDDLGDDIWYAVATIDDIGRLVDSEITAFEFVERIRVLTP